MNKKENEKQILASKIQPINFLCACVLLLTPLLLLIQNLLLLIFLLHQQEYFVVLNHDVKFDDYDNIQHILIIDKYKAEKPNEKQEQTNNNLVNASNKQNRSVILTQTQQSGIKYLTHV